MTSGGHLVQHHHAKQDQLQCYIGLCPVHSWLSPRMEISQLFNAKFDHSHSNHVFLLYLVRISLVSADFHPLLCISEESSLHLPVRYLQTAVRPVQSFLFVLDRLSSLSLSFCVMLPASAHSGCVLLDSLQLTVALYWGSHSWKQYLSCSPTTAE